jgi:transglutaminase-like putative cysteine protease
MPLFKIQHITKYNYDRLIQESVNEIRIFPLESDDQQIVEQNLVTTGNPEMMFFVDYWGNKTGAFNLLTPHHELIIRNDLLVRTRESTDLRVDFLSNFDALRREVFGNIRMLELSIADTIQSQPSILEIVGSVSFPDDSLATTIKNSSDYIFDHFKYVPGITDIETTVDEILRQSAGVCQDFSHLLLQILRTMKIPSRYVSGYICPHRSGLRGEGATHAWVEAWIPGSGWTGIDPTNKIWVTNNHVKLATGRNFADCTPVKGSFKGEANQVLSVFVSVDYENGQQFENQHEVQTIKSKSPVDSPHFSPAAQQ